MRNATRMPLWRHLVIEGRSSLDTLDTPPPDPPLPPLRELTSAWKPVVSMTTGRMQAYGFQKRHRTYGPCIRARLQRVSNHVEFEFRVRVRVSSKFWNFMWIKTVQLFNEMLICISFA